MNKEEKNSNKCPICGRQPYKESKFCIFHAGAEEKTKEEFKKALKEYINSIKKENKDHNFERFIFIGDINFAEDFNVTVFKYAEFWKATFKGDADFSEAIFEGYAEFKSAIFEGYAGFKMATFKGDAEFKRATFKTDVDFRKAIFEEHAGFKWATFIANIRFSEATFKGDAEFWKVIFEGGPDFRMATFKGNAEFWEATFVGSTDFRKATFEGDAFFRDVTFKGYAELKVKYLIVIIDFSEIRIFSGKKLSIKIISGVEGKINFNRAYLENANLDMKLVKDTLIDFTDALLKNTKIKKRQIEDHILQKKKKNFSEAKEIYLLIKNNFHSIGQYEDESWAFTKERDMDKMSNSFYGFLNKYKKYSLFKIILRKNNLLKRVIIKAKIFKKWLFSKKAIKWFNLSVSNFIYQYGENPWRVIRFASIIIFLFAIILNFSGIVNSDSTNLIIEFIKENQGGEYNLKYFGPILGSFLNCLYFSVVTFTTLGYGDFQPAVGASRFFVSVESIIGAFTMALFVYTFARRTGGR